MGEAESTWGRLLPHLRFEVLRPEPPSAALDGASAMRAALDHAGLARLAAQAAEAGEPLTFVVNDGHRLTATSAFLEAAFAVLDAASPAVKRAPVRALVAGGSHRADRAERRVHEETAFGEWRARLRDVAWHDADDEASLARLGEHRFHSWMVEGGFYVACGSVEPHYFAGATGAHKTLTVGVMSRAAIEANHAAAMSSDAVSLRLDGNPVHEGVVAALGALEGSGARLLALNQVIVDGRIVDVAAGHPLQTLQQLQRRGI